MLINGKNQLTPEQLGILETELKAVLEKLAPMLAEAIAEAEAKKKETVLSEEEIRGLFERLESMLNNHNPECVDLVDSLMAVPGTEELIQQIEGFKFKQALAALSELRKKGVNDGKDR
uniref:Uncharacterized protein n=1 Tax=uncultured bacterium contig00030 TaxID=1181519 RepID=A0A806KM36_9BACT|nr:hypothetical protein [uncultured bacterium contig00030]